MGTRDGTLYFAYGSNLSLEQMRRRCPDSAVVGVCHLTNYRWIINTRCYANIVATKTSVDVTTAVQVDVERVEDKEHVVWGLLYKISASDEASLDLCEGVPWAYTKEYVNVTLWNIGSTSFDMDKGTKVMALAYVDTKNVGHGKPSAEYVIRMRRALKDAISHGIPKAWIQQAMGNWITYEEDKREEKKARGNKTG